MVRQSVSRRSLLAAAGASVAISMAGCLGEGSCRTITAGAATVEPHSIAIHDADIEAGQRLYVRFRRLSGPQASLSVFDPSEEPLIQLAAVDRLERVFEPGESGRYAVVTRNESATDTGRWETTVTVYRGWCADVF